MLRLAIADFVVGWVDAAGLSDQGQLDRRAILSRLVLIPMKPVLRMVGDCPHPALQLGCVAGIGCNTWTHDG